MKTSTCGAMCHDVRNALLSIQGIVLCLGKDDPRVAQVNKQVQRIATAIKPCDADKSKCSRCEYGVEMR